MILAKILGKIGLKNASGTAINPATEDTLSTLNGKVATEAALNDLIRLMQVLLQFRKQSDGTMFVNVANTSVAVTGTLTNMTQLFGLTAEYHKYWESRNASYNQSLI